MKEENSEFLRQFFQENNLCTTPLSQESSSTNEEKKKSQETSTLSKSQKDINLKSLFQTIEDEKKNYREQSKREREEREEREEEGEGEEEKREEREEGEEGEEEKKQIIRETVRKEVKTIQNTEIYKTETNNISLEKEEKGLPIPQNTENTKKLKKQSTTLEETISPIKIIAELRKFYDEFLRVLPIMEKSIHLDEIQSHTYRTSRIQQEYIPELWENKDSIIFKEWNNIPYTKKREEKEKKEIPKKQNISLIKKKEEKESVQKEDLKHTKEQEQKQEKEKKNNSAEKIIQNEISQIRFSKAKFSTLKAQLAAKKNTLLRSKKKKLYSQKKESGILELFKIISIVATVFIVSMVGLNYSAFLERYEQYWNAEEFEQKQESVTKLVSTPAKEEINPYKSIPSLPIAGRIPEKTEKNFDIKMYLNISPPDARIVIPKLGKNIPILTVPSDSREKGDWEKLEGDIQEALRDGVVHYPGTANPGQNGNVFITGHSSYYPWDNGKYKDVFAALHNLEVGDEYYIYFKGKKYKYVISTRKVVSPSDVSVLEQDTDQKISTLMTCTPIGTTAKRLILQAKETEIGY